MANINVKDAKTHLENFDFTKLFVEELGWSVPKQKQSVVFEQDGAKFTRRQLAELSGVVVYEISASTNAIPEAKTRAAIHKQISQISAENVLVFVDGSDGDHRTQCMWYWVKREASKAYPREHLYVKGQPVDLFLGKLNAMVVDISEFDAEGNIEVTKVADRLKKALDVEQVTRKFYKEFQEQHLAFLELIKGIDDDRDRRWYASVLLNRLMFIYFLQRKGFVKGFESATDYDYLQKGLERSKARGENLYYQEFLHALFFEGFAKAEEDRSDETKRLISSVHYLNGGLFLKHPIEQRWTSIRVPDAAFVNLLSLFTRYTWNLDDTPGGQANEINPDVLGYIFEKYINQKAFGAYYTRPEITQYLCEQTIHKLILDKVNSIAAPDAGSTTALFITAKHDGLFGWRKFASIEDLLINLDAHLCRYLLDTVLPDLKLLDPACGSGAFLVAAMKTLINVYAHVIGKIEFVNDAVLKRRLDKWRQEHKSLNYFIKREIITNNLFGVDVMEESTEIAKLRLFLALVASAQDASQLEPLPNIDFNILAGNSLIGLMHVSESDYNSVNPNQWELYRNKSYAYVLSEKNRLIRQYKNYKRDTNVGLEALRDNIRERKREDITVLNDLLLREFTKLGIKFEQATWDKAKGKEGKPTKRAVKLSDIEALQPFHWGYEFDEILNQSDDKKGFDAIITNPPWEIFKPNAKEFFAEHSELVTKNKMTIKEFEKEQGKQLKRHEVRDAWLEYQDRFPHVSLYFRNSPQYKNQISIVGGKKAGTDINLYKLFVEQCFNLLRKDGECGIVIPSGIYTDLGTKQLREMLFGETKITGLFCFENRREIFEGVDSRFKFVVLTYKRGDVTETFPTAFMRHDVKELQEFPRVGALHVSVELIRRLSPDSLSLMEFKSDTDVRIAEKANRFPLMGKHIEGNWNLSLTNEFHMTNDSHLFKTMPCKNCLPLYEGKVIHQFTHQWGKAKYWIDEKEARKALVGRSNADVGQMLDYQKYRLAFREIASNTNERGMIASMLPTNVFANHKLMLSRSKDDVKSAHLVYCCAVLNSFVYDYQIRQRTTTTISMFTFYQLPVPRLNESHKDFTPIVERAAKLICTTPEFDDLAASVGLGDHTAGVTDAGGRAFLRAELDGRIAHLYGLTEDEFAHILATFPLVAAETKQAALDQYRLLAPNPDDRVVAALIEQGESERLEFKVAARHNPFTKKKDDSMRDNIAQAVAAFLNSREGGAVLVGVADDNRIVGLADDYIAVNAQKPGRDSYELFLRALLDSTLGGERTRSCKITFHNINDADVCRITVEPSPKPAFIKGELYVRHGNRKKKLTAQEAIEYQRARWSE